MNRCRIGIDTALRSCLRHRGLDLIILVLAPLYISLKLMARSVSAWAKFLSTLLILQLGYRIFITIGDKLLEYISTLLINFYRFRKYRWFRRLSYLFCSEGILDSIVLVFILSHWAIRPPKLLTAHLAVLAILILRLVLNRNFCAEPLLMYERWQPFLLKLLLISNLYQRGHIGCVLEIDVVDISIFLLLDMRTLLVLHIDRLLSSFWNQESQWLRGVDNLKIIFELLPSHWGLELLVWLPEIKGLP
jgi:hypothetical protein